MTKAELLHENECLLQGYRFLMKRLRRLRLDVQNQNFGSAYDRVGKMLLDVDEILNPPEELS